MRTEVFDSSNALVATMLPNLASAPESYASYDKEYATLPSKPRWPDTPSFGSRGGEAGTRASAIRQNYLEM